MTREQAIHHAARILAASTTGCAAMTPREQAEAASPPSTIPTPGRTRGRPGVAGRRVAPVRLPVAWTPTSAYTVEQLETLIRQRRQAPAKAS